MIRDLIHHAAGTADTPSRKQLPGGRPARPGPQRVRTGLVITVVSAVAVVAAGCASSSASSPARSSASSRAAAQPASSSNGAIHSRSTIHFPATLFGLPHNTGGTAQQIARGVTHGLAAIPIASHPQVAVYGTGATSQMILVLIADLSAAAKKYGAKPTAAGLRRGLLVMGVTGVQTFAAGKGAALACGHLTRSGLTATYCMRYTKRKSAWSCTSVRPPLA